MIWIDSSQNLRPATIKILMTDMTQFKPQSYFTVHLPKDTFLIHHCGLEPQDREDDHGGQNGSEPVDDGHDDGILLAVVLFRIIAGEADHASKAQTEGVEDLGGRVQPDLRVL